MVKSKRKKEARKKPSSIMDDNFTSKSHANQMKIAYGVLGVTGVSVLVFLFMFFSSGTQERLLHVHAEPQGDNSIDQQIIEPDDTASSDSSENDITQNDDNTDIHIQVLPSEEPITLTDDEKEQIIAELDAMDTEEFEILIQSIVSNNLTKSDDSVSKQSPDKKKDASDKKAHEDAFIITDDESIDGQSLEEAYTQAEIHYPGQIDGSKRLKLVEDLNSGAYQYYVVEKGDTLYTVIDGFDVPLGQLIEMNGIQNANHIEAGDILLLPDNVEQPDLSNK